MIFCELYKEFNSRTAVENLAIKKKVREEWGPKGSQSHSDSAPQNLVTSVSVDKKLIIQAFIQSTCV